jgi:predicted amidophosphoribosyltransferase
MPALTDGTAAEPSLPAWFPLRWQLPSAVCPAEPLQGIRPLRWWSAGWYSGELRNLILRLRNCPQPELLAPSAPVLHRALVSITAEQHQQPLLLVPIPSGRRRGNPLPDLMARSLLERSAHNLAVAVNMASTPALLQRSRRVAVQHRLGRQQRWRNQWLSFRALLPAPEHKSMGSSVLLIDDVLTSGATAMAAQQALQSAGWSVAGLLCMARTPQAQGQGVI